MRRLTAPAAVVVVFVVFVAALAALTAAACTPTAPERPGASPPTAPAVSASTPVTPSPATTAATEASATTPAPDDAGTDAAVEPRRRGSTQPFIRPVKWLCDEQDCEHAPRFAYDYLPAISADGQHVAVVEERDGWGHTRDPGVRVVSAATGTSERFFPVVFADLDLTKDLRGKIEYEARIRAANDALAAYDFRPLFPPGAPDVSVDHIAGTKGDRRRVRRTYRVAGIVAEIGSTDQEPPTDRLDEVVIRAGATTKRVPAKDWSAQSGCSTRAFALAGVRPELKAAVFVSELVRTGHNCDGVPEKQPWAVRVVRW